MQDNDLPFQLRGQIVPHDFKYHAEIRYETERGFKYVMACGDTIDTVCFDIKEQLEKWEFAGRSPKLEVVYYDPNGEKADVTYKIRTILEKGKRDV